MDAAQMQQLFMAMQAQQAQQQQGATNDQPKEQKLPRPKTLLSSFYNSIQLFLCKTCSEESRNQDPEMLADSSCFVKVKMCPKCQKVNTHMKLYVIDQFGAKKE